MSSVTPPTLRTERLVLRPVRIGDYPAYRVFMASRRSAFMGGPYDEPAAWGSFCHDVACWVLFGHGAVMIEVAASGQCVGQVGINHGPLFPEKELGWLLYDGFEGHGYATEAAMAMLAWARDVGGIETLVSYIDAGNARSIRIAERLGAIRDLDARGQDPEDVVYRHSLR
jgi:RimJ/RimL family protein N-acetyltransferase